MTIVYCDWTSGNDSTGDGSAGNPYKTINQASTGLTGGDEVRVAKSPAHTALSETLSWTDNSTSVGTSGDLTGELAVADMIGKDADDGMWWEITAINSTTITLRAPYSGTTETVTSYKMGFHDYGSVAASSTQVQSVSAGGSSTSSMLTISGGWNLATETQDGLSFFCQTHASNRYGTGLYLNYRHYVSLSKIIISRCYQNIYPTGCTGLEFDAEAYSSGQHNFYVFNCVNYNFTSIKAGSAGYCNFYLTGDRGYIGTLITASNLSGSSSYPACSFAAEQVIVKHVTSRNNNTYGISTEIGNFFGEMVIDNNTQGLRISSNTGAGKTRIGSLSATGNTYAVYIYNYGAVQIGSFVGSGNTNDIGVISTYLNDTPQPAATVQRWNNTAGDSRMFWYVGTAYRNTAEARSGACLKVAPTDAGEYCWVTLGKYLVTATGSDITLSVYAKDDASFNGDVGLMALVNNGPIANWTEKTMTTSYVEQTIIVPAADLIENEWIELIARVRGTAGAVYFDDFSAS